jgi:hypothetical protein
MIADELNINECTAFKIVTQDLNIRKFCVKIVPENVNDDKNAGRNDVSVKVLERLETKSHFLTWVITGEESCFFEYDPKTMRNSKE